MNSEDSRRAPRKARKSQGASNSVVVQVQRGTSMSGWGDLIATRSDLPGLDRFYMLATPQEWRVFINAVKNGEFDLDGDNLLPALAAH